MMATPRAIALMPHSMNFTLHNQHCRHGNDLLITTYQRPDLLETVTNLQNEHHAVL